jgi:hypothetical protein
MCTVIDGLLRSNRTLESTTKERHCLFEDDGDDGGDSETFSQITSRKPYSSNNDG